MCYNIMYICIYAHTLPFPPVASIRQKLSALESYPRLMERARRVGFFVESCLYCGFEPSSELKSYYSAMATLESKLQGEVASAAQKRELNEIELQTQKKSVEQEHELDKSRMEYRHKREWEDVKHKIELERALQEAKSYERQRRDEEIVAFLSSLKQQGVDLTKVLSNPKGSLFKEECRGSNMELLT